MPHGQRISKGHPKQETARDPRFIARAASQRSQWDGSHLEIHLVVGFLDCGLGGLWLVGSSDYFFFPKTDSKEKWSSSVPWFHHDGVSMLIKDACFLTFSNNLLSFIFFGGKFKVQTEVSTQGPGCLRSVLESFQSSWRSCTHFIPFFSYSAEMTDQMSKIWYTVILHQIQWISMKIP